MARTQITKPMHLYKSIYTARKTKNLHNSYDIEVIHQSADFRPSSAPQTCQIGPSISSPIVNKTHISMGIT